MAGVYDQLSAHFDDDESSGFSSLDLADLPDDQRQVIVTLLRETASNLEGVGSDTLHARLDVRIENLDETLALLQRYHWVIAFGEPPRQRYRLNLRAKRGSSTGFNLWAVLTDRLPKDWKGNLSIDAT